MARIATLLGKDVKSGSWSALAISDGVGLDDLLALRKKIRSQGGVLKNGKSEKKFSELRVLANRTAGGELKARCLFK